MESSESGLNIQITEKAMTFIKTRRLRDPLVMVNMGYRTDSGDSSSGCGGGGCGGGGGEGQSSPSIPYVNVVLVDGGKPGDDFAKVETQAGIPVYLSKAALKKAKESKKTLILDLKGLVMKRFSLEGLDLGTAGQSQKGSGGC